MSNLNRKTAIYLIIILHLLINICQARVSYSSKELHNNFKSADPAHSVVAHRVGELGLAVSNNGTLGTGFVAVNPIDLFTGQVVESSNFPERLPVSYLFGGGVWVGAIVDRDTLVSTTADGWAPSFEFVPDNNPFGYIIKRSINDTSVFYNSAAVSEEDYIAVYRDTTANISYDYFGRPHRPMNLEVTQKSYAWSYPHTEDFVLIDYTIKNIGYQELNEVYVGIFMDPDVGNTTGPSAGTRHIDDLTGLLIDYEFDEGICSYTDSMYVAWATDNNGDPTNGTYYSLSSPNSAVGIKILSPYIQPGIFSYNWYTSDNDANLDFGPREKSGVGYLNEEFRDFRTGGLGTPSGDVNKYYLMRNREIDYNQYFTYSITEDDSLWMFPDQNISEWFTMGKDIRYVMSIGPIQSLNHDETITFTVAYVAGEDLHTNINAITYLPDHPDWFENSLDFSDLANNTRWAEWVYDNPGVDTDGDGYFGEYIVCNSDTTWIKGDGVPDYNPAIPPEPPIVRLESDGEQMIIRWNGLKAETTKDKITGDIDFEGYKVYFQNGLGSFWESEPYELIAEYDKEDYIKYYYVSWPPGWHVDELVFSLEELRCLYAVNCDDLSFNPLSFTEETPFFFQGDSDSLFYFQKVGNNNSELGITTPIVKSYPNQPYPSTLNPEEANPDELTNDGYLKYFEYELTIDLNQNYYFPRMCYKVGVTTQDYGWPPMNVPPQESIKNKSELLTCVEIKAELKPDTIYAFMQYSVEPITAALTVGFDETGMIGKPLNFYSFDFELPIDSVKTLFNQPGFIGKSYVMYFSLNDYLNDQSPVFGTSQFMDNYFGNYSDGDQAFTTLSYLVIGHRHGDLNLDDKIDISDIFAFVQYAFQQGSPPRYRESSDINQDNEVNIADLVLLINLVF